MIAVAVFSCGGKETPETPKAPAVPVNLTLHRSTENSLSFQWDEVEGATSYDWTLTQGGSMVKEGTSTARNAIITGLAKATTYAFCVRSVAGELSSSYSQAIEATTAGTPDPSGPDTPGTPGTSDFDYSEFRIPEAEEDGKPRAFPGAEGGGRFVTGGRGGAVIHVSNLNDSGSGSLRAAINTKGPRTIVFDVAGTIELKSALKVEKNYGDLTIAGQTAPGDGICLKNYNFRINASNVIIRYLRFRMGDEKKTEDDALNLYTGDNDIRDVIIDHCSLSWSTDECGSFYGMTNFTLQWCILSESLRNSVHGKGKHGYGGIWGGANATYHHNLLAHHDSRNPRLDHDYVSTLKGPVDIVNNVIYNWGSNTCYGGESANGTNTFKQYNVVANYYKPGPATGHYYGDKKIRFIDPTTSCSNCTSEMGVSTVVPGHFYMTGNYMSGHPGMTADNWTATTADAATIAAIRSDSPFHWSDGAMMMTVHSAEDAFDQVTEYAGASLRRDPVDRRVAEETVKGTFTFEGSETDADSPSRKGFIDTQEDVGGWPTYSATETEEARMKKDTDKDGIPDSYEDFFGLDKDNAADGKAVSLDIHGRYTNLEMYLHYLVREITAGQVSNGKYKKL